MRITMVKRLPADADRPAAPAAKLNPEMRSR